jgi:hypothetical protein
MGSLSMLLSYLVSECVVGPLIEVDNEQQYRHADRIVEDWSWWSSLEFEHTSNFDLTLDNNDATVIAEIPIPEVENVFQSDMPQISDREGPESPSPVIGGMMNPNPFPITDPDQLTNPGYPGDNFYQPPLSGFACSRCGKIKTLLYPEGEPVLFCKHCEWLWSPQGDS